MWTQVCCNNQSASEDVKVIVANGPDDRAGGTGVFLKDLAFEVEEEGGRGGAEYLCENQIP